jgi:twitching motility protein PilT
MDITDLLTFTKNSGASDLHLSAGVEPMIRIDGAMRRIDAPPLTKEEIHELLFDILTDEQQAAFQEKLELDFAIELENVARFRVNLFVQYRGEAAAFRLIPSKIKSLDELGLPRVLAEMANAENGLVLVTGPTGSGKSTTLAAMIDLINTHQECHIITVEDPIEFLHTSKKSLMNQREVQRHTHSFANALRSALREDPDVILVGELRDLETTQLAVTAAETGHLVFATLHTSDAGKTVDRLIDIFPTHQQAQIRAMLSESLRGVAAQQLLPRIGGGRAAAVEILVATSAVRNMIREQKTYQIPSVIQTGGRLGMQTMRQAIETLVVRGLVSREFLPKPGEGDEKGPGEVGAGGPRPSFPPPPGAPPSDFEAWRQKSKPK